MHQPAAGTACKARILKSYRDMKVLQANLLWIPNRGKIPPNDDRVKLFAARALAANVGYASTRNVKMPE
jgi:hypothetical protein